MSDITEAVSQDEIAESLLGPSSERVEEAAAEPGPEAEQSTEQVEELAAEPEQEVAQEEDADWLPDEQEKVFPLDVLTKYGIRYGYKPEEIQADPRIQTFLKDKINTDIYVRQQQIAQQLQPETQEPTPQTPQQQQPQTYEQQRQQIAQWVQGQIDPQRAQQFMQALSNESDPVKAATLLATEAADWAMRSGNLILQQVRSEIGKMVEEAYPEFGEMHYNTSCQKAWESVRTSDQRFAALPQYSSPQFTKLVGDTIAKVPGLQELVDAAEAKGNGRMSPSDAKKFYGVIAAMAASSSPDPKLIQQAVQTGKTLARKSQVTKQAGNLGAGQSKQNTSGGGDDDYFAEGIAEYQKQHGRL